MAFGYSYQEHALLAAGIGFRGGNRGVLTAQGISRLQLPPFAKASMHSDAPTRSCRRQMKYI